jgi:sarcosine oxidase, subunit gamma
MPEAMTIAPDSASYSQSPLFAHVWRNPAQAAPAWPGQPQAQIKEMALLGYLNLRGDAGDAFFAQTILQHLQLELPQKNNTVTVSRQHPDATLYWLGPDEYLAALPRHKAEQAVAALHTQLKGHQQGSSECTVVDVTGGYTQLELRDANRGDVRLLLARGCPLDLHPSAFRAGQCAQTHLAKAPVLLHCVSVASSTQPVDVLRLIVRRSFAGYVATWLDDARR